MKHAKKTFVLLMVAALMLTFIPAADNPFARIKAAIARSKSLLNTTSAAELPERTGSPADTAPFPFHTSASRKPSFRTRSVTE